jgi:hypothetical protein
LAVYSVGMMAADSAVQSALSTVDEMAERTVVTVVSSVES